MHTYTHILTLSYIHTYIHKYVDTYVYIMYNSMNFCSFLT